MGKSLLCLRLKNELWKRGIKQIDLALEIRMDPARLSKIINGREEAPETIKRSIADHLGMTEAELF
ncbi:MAG: XRE family transcriptional regulator [Deltaproteobacteria bacterium HGW-Deltaproteobacteria-21]|nr:MAG: XRE family transcriptional regulator [Deltaproteobacteria bacterium HGW-Deltaproteobacteria-21]